MATTTNQFQALRFHRVKSLAHIRAWCWHTWQPHMFFSMCLNSKMRGRVFITNWPRGPWQVKPFAEEQWELSIEELFSQSTEIGGGQTPLIWMVNLKF